MLKKVQRLRGQQLQHALHQPKAHFVCAANRHLSHPTYSRAWSAAASKVAEVYAPLPYFHPLPVRPHRDPLSESETNTNQATSLALKISTASRAPNKRKSQQERKAEVLDDLVRQLFANKKATKQKLLAIIKRKPTLAASFSDFHWVHTIAQKLAPSAPLDSLKTLSLAHALETRVKTSAYECVAHAMAESEQWKYIPVVITQCQRLLGCLSVRLVNWLARAQIEREHYAGLHLILPMLAQYNLLPNRRTYHLLLSGYIRNHDLSQAKAIIVAMESAGFPVDASTSTIISSVYRVLGPDQQVQADALESLKTSTGAQATLTLNALVKNYLAKDNVSDALRLLSFFDQSKLEPNLSQDSGEDIIHLGGDAPSQLDTRSCKIAPDSNTFNALIEYMAKRRDLDITLRTVDRMKAAGFSPDSKTVASLIRAYFRAGDGTTAIHSVITLCKARGVRVESWGHLQPIALPQQQPFDPSAITPTLDIFNALIRGILSTRGLKDIYPVLQIMREFNLDPDTTTIHLVLVYLDRNEKSSPKILLRVLRRLTRGTVRPNIRHLYIILRSVIRRERLMLNGGNGWESLRRQHSRALSFAPKRLTSTLRKFDPSAGLKVPKRSAYTSRFKHMFRSLTSRELRADGDLISLRIRRDAVCKGDLDQAEEVFKTMLARGIHPEPYHYAALMEGYARIGDMSSAEEVLDHAMKAGIKPNVVLFTIIIAGYAQNKKPKLAVKTFQRMLLHKIKPDIAAIDAVCAAFFAVGSFLMAKEMLVALWPHIAPLPHGFRAMSLQEMSMRFRALHDSGKNARHALSKGEKMKMYLTLQTMVKGWKSLSEREILAETRSKRS